MLQIDSRVNDSSMDENSDRCTQPGNYVIFLSLIITKYIYIFQPFLKCR